MENSYVIFTFFQIDQGGLGLPERQYYLNESDRKVGQEYKMFQQWIVTNLKFLLFPHTVGVMRLYLSKKNNILTIFT